MPRLDQLPSAVPGEGSADELVAARGVAAAAVDADVAPQITAPPLQSALHAALAAREERQAAGAADLGATPVVQQRLAEIAERGDPPAHPGPHARP